MADLYDVLDMQSPAEKRALNLGLITAGLGALSGIGRPHYGRGFGQAFTPINQGILAGLQTYKTVLGSDIAQRRANQEYQAQQIALRQQQAQQQAWGDLVAQQEDPVRQQQMLAAGREAFAKSYAPPAPSVATNYMLNQDGSISPRPVSGLENQGVQNAFDVKIAENKALSQNIDPVENARLGIAMQDLALKQRQVENSLQNQAATHYKELVDKYGVDNANSIAQGGKLPIPPLGKQLPEAANTAYLGNQNTLNVIEQARQSLFAYPKGVGAKNILLGGAAQYTDKEGNRVRTDVNIIGKQLIYDISGAATTARDEATTRDYVPTVNDSADKILTNLNRMEKAVQAKQDAIIEHYGAKLPKTEKAAQRQQEIQKIPTSELLKMQRNSKLKGTR